MTIRILLALEEAGIQYQVERFDDGHFRAAHGVPGPALLDDGFLVVEPNAVLRHVGRAYGGMPADLRGQAEADRWIELQARIARALGTSDGATVRSLLGHVDRRLQDSAWLAGDFSVADCGMAALAQSDRLSLDGHPALLALPRYFDALRARPAFERAAARAVA